MVNMIENVYAQQTDLQNYTQFADKISRVFVSYHLMIQ